MPVGIEEAARVLFGNWWMKAAKAETTENAVHAIVVTVIVSFISAGVLAGASAIVHDFYGGSFLVNTVVTGIILWGGFTAACFITHDAFENRPGCSPCSLSRTSL